MSFAEEVKEIAEANPEAIFYNPDTYSINGYSALAVLAEGVKKAGTVDDAVRIAEAIRGLDFDTPIGHIAYDTQGDLRDPQIYIFQVRSGEFVQVYPKQPKTRRLGYEEQLPASVPGGCSF